jgi:hypothetical protein
MILKHIMSHQRFVPVVNIYTGHIFWNFFLIHFKSLYPYLTTYFSDLFRFS